MITRSKGQNTRQAWPFPSF